MKKKQKKNTANHWWFRHRQQPQNLKKNFNRERVGADKEAAVSWKMRWEHRKRVGEKKTLKRRLEDVMLQRNEKNRPRCHFDLFDFSLVRRVCLFNYLQISRSCLSNNQCNSTILVCAMIVSRAQDLLSDSQNILSESSRKLKKD